MAMITLEAVTKTYQRGLAVTTALRGVSLQIAQGEFVSFMGPSGSGKSTLLHLIGALDIATSGRIMLGDFALHDLDDRALTQLRRLHLGFVFQFFNLLHTMSALENAALPALMSGRKESEALARARILLERMGLGARLHHRAYQLSGGEMQRVAIARALVNDPMVVLADEPTGNLDSHTGTEVLRLLREATRERGVTVVMVTHDPSAAAVGDRTITLRDGEITSHAAGDALRPDRLS